MAMAAEAIPIAPGSIVEEDDLLSNLADPSYQSWLHSIDAIVLLGGGVPLSPTEPPLYVQRRCDVVAQIMTPDTMPQLPAVICLSAGTAHVPQYITPHNGLPLWESTASAAYLMRHERHPVRADQVYAETTSYDTISNAFFARTSFMDIHANWRRILVVTNEFHIRRSKAIFDWIYHAPNTALDTKGNNDNSYEMYYLSCNNVGLSSEAVSSRKSHEARGETNVRTKLSVDYPTLQGVWEFLTTQHDFYTAEKLMKTALGEEEGASGGTDNLLKLSYGKSSATTLKLQSSLEYKDGKVIFALDVYVLVAVAMMAVGVCIALVRNNRCGPDKGCGPEKESKWV